MIKKLTDIAAAGCGITAGMMCMLSRNRIDMALFAVPFAALAVLSGNKSSRIRSLCLLFYGGALISVSLMRAGGIRTYSMRPAAACLCPLAAYALSDIRRVGFLKLLLYMSLGFMAMCFDYGRMAAVGCGMFLALSYAMMRSAYSDSITLDV